MSESQITSPIGQNLANYWGLMLGDIEDQADLVALIESINIAGGVVIEDDLLSVSIITSLSANQGRVLKEYIDAHLADVANPHAVTATQVELGSVDNTADANKPVSADQQAAIDASKASVISEASTGGNGVADSSKLLAFSADGGIQALVSGSTKVAGQFSASGSGSKAVSCISTDAAAKAFSVTTSGGVFEIYGDGSCTISATVEAELKNALEIENLDNTADLDKLISNDTQTALDLKEPITVVRTATVGRDIDDSDIGSLLKLDGYVLNLNPALMSVSGSFVIHGSGYLSMTGSDDITLASNESAVITVDHVAATVNAIPSVLTATALGLGSVDDTSDADKPVSSDTQTALNLKEDSRAFLADGTISANKTFTDGDYGKIFAVSGSYTLTLPPPDSSNYGQRIGLYVNSALASATFAGSIPSGQNVATSITNITQETGLLMIESTFSGWFANSQYKLIDCTMSGSLSIPDPLTLDATSTTNLRAAVGIGLTSVKTTTYSATTSDGVIVGRHATIAFTISLLAVAGNLGASVKIINGGLSGQATITVDVTGGGSNISEAGVAVASVDLLPGESVEFENDGTIWITT